MKRRNYRKQEIRRQTTKLGEVQEEIGGEYPTKPTKKNKKNKIYL
jgi:hypothetical protein